MQIQLKVAISSISDKRVHSRISLWPFHLCSKTQQKRVSEIRYKTNKQKPLEKYPFLVILEILHSPRVPVSTIH